MRRDVGNWKIQNYNAIHEAEKGTHTHTHSIILLDFIKFYVKTHTVTQNAPNKKIEEWENTHLYSEFHVISWFMSAATGNESSNKYVHL